MEQIAQAKRLLQFSSRGMILSPGGSQGICCYKMTVLVAARPCASPCMRYVSRLSLVVPSTGSVQDIGETVTT